VGYGESKGLPAGITGLQRESIFVGSRDSYFFGFGIGQASNRPYEAVLVFLCSCFDRYCTRGSCRETRGSCREPSRTGAKPARSNLRSGIRLALWLTFNRLHLVRHALRLDYAQHCDRYISSKRFCNLCGLYGPQTPPTKLVVASAPSPALKLIGGSGDPFDISPRRPEEYSLVYTNDRHSKLRKLPKGRKDIGESIAEAALRETFEETGYKCSNFLPLPASTLAPAPGTKPEIRSILNTEAVAIRLWSDSRSREAEKIKVQKFIHWYVAEVDVDEKGVPVPRVENTQLPYEQYDVCEMSLEQACREEDGLSFPEDRLMIASVLELLAKRYHIFTSEANLT